ncbi:MAG: indole-3-glycerol-phosphate synthase [Alphaproteobacteria bacterium CG11_big_fil_rev_8_21_14_0_20_44_7]|nr:MAG: indole-3-glycerol-phosphate synthase [Alphaproteobacteria bacterium CG11_big_fil_rev_8_21_14_0_20_44_7]
MSKLNDIIDAKVEYVKACEQKVSFKELDKMAKDAPPVRGFAKALRAKQENNQLGLIAEIKKASPSKGLIRADFNPAELAKAYEEGGATCLSVLTDEPFFQGSDEYLKQARAATNLPVLRKDFTIHLYQVLEARAMGADAILLILSILEDDNVREMEALAMYYGMDVLLEVHNREEMKRAVGFKSKLIGVNNRDLWNFEVDMNTSKRLWPLYPDGHVRICESGIASHEDVLEMQRYRYNCFLVGESLMRQDDVKSATMQLLGK